MKFIKYYSHQNISMIKSCSYIFIFFNRITDSDNLRHGKMTLKTKNCAIFDPSFKIDPNTFFMAVFIDLGVIKHG